MLPSDWHGDPTGSIEREKNRGRGRKSIVGSNREGWDGESRAYFRPRRVCFGGNGTASAAMTVGKSASSWSRNMAAK